MNSWKLVATTLAAAGALSLALGACSSSSSADGAAGSSAAGSSAEGGAAGEAGAAGADNGGSGGGTATNEDLVAASVAPTAIAACSACITTKDTMMAVANCYADTTGTCAGIVTTITTDAASMNVPAGCVTEAAVGTNMLANDVYTLIATDCSDDCGKFSIPENAATDQSCTAGAGGAGNGGAAGAAGAAGAGGG